MPITIKHAPDPRLLADLAYRVGRGGAYLRERERNDQLEQEQYRRRMQEFELQQQLEQQARDNQFRQQQAEQLQQRDARNFYEPSYQDQYQQERDQQQFGLAQDENERGWQQLDLNYRTRQDQLDWQQQQQMMRNDSYRRSEEAKYNGTWKYSAAQEQRRSQILNDINATKTDHSLFPDQQEDILNRLYAEYDEMQPDHFEKNQGPSLQEAAQSELLPEYDEATGKLIGKWHRAGDGKWTFTDLAPKAAAKQPDIKIDEKQIDAAKEQAIANLSNPTYGWDPAPTEQQILAETQRILTEREKIKQGVRSQLNPQADAGTQGATGAAQPPSDPGAPTDQGAMVNQQARDQQLQQMNDAVDAALASGDPEQMAAALEALNQAGI